MFCFTCCSLLLLLTKLGHVSFLSSVLTSWLNCKIRNQAAAKIWKCNWMCPGGACLFSIQSMESPSDLFILLASIFSLTSLLIISDLQVPNCMFPCNSNLNHIRDESRKRCAPDDRLQCFAIWGDKKAKPRICFLLCIHAEGAGQFFIVISREHKGRKRQHDFPLCSWGTGVASSVGWEVKDGFWSMPQLGTAWILGYWLIPFSLLGRTDPNSSFSCGQVDRKGQGKERAGKGNWAGGEDEGEMRLWLLQEFIREFLLQVVWQWGGKAYGWQCSRYL